MNININLYATQVKCFLQDSITSSNETNKRIFAIVTVALAFLAACYFIRSIFLVGAAPSKEEKEETKPVEEETKPIEDVKKEVKVERHCFHTLDNKIGFPKSYIAKGTRVLCCNWPNEASADKLGTIVGLRDDAHERKNNWKDQVYFYHVDFDDGKFDTYVESKNLFPQK